MTSQASFRVSALFLLSLGCAGAAVVEQRAQITGGGGDGKCTIEVRVDGAAEIQVLGDRARMRTLEGRPAEWRRFICNQPLPRNPGSFRFKGIDGRGLQELLQEPSGGRPAVVRIEDRQGGSEGYTFDLIWRGGSAWGDNGPGGWGNQGWQGNWGNQGGNGYREVRFRGRGSGYYRNNRGANDRLGDCQVTIDRNGNVEVSLRNEQNFTLGISGRVTETRNDRIVAQVSGPGMSGVMYLRLDGNRVREITMEGGGRQRFELRWNGD